MPTFTTVNSSVTALGSELVTSALTEIGVLGQGNVVQAGDAAWALEKLQRLIDRFNARQAMISNVNFSLFTLIANHQPHTIGPTGDFNMPQRPVKLVAANLVLGGTTPVDIPLYVGDDAWWADQRVKSLTSTLPTGVYYSPDNPLGNLNFWPIPTQVNQVRLELWTGLTQAVGLATALAMPSAYWDAVVLSLARDLAPSYGPEALQVVSSAAFSTMYRDAIKAIQANNMQSPRIATAEAGQGCGDSRGDFNYLTGGRA